MKKKILLVSVLLAIVIIVAGCGETANATSQNESNFYLEKVGYCKDVTEYRDTKTGVHYLIFSDTRGNAGQGGICPRYNAVESGLSGLQKTKQGCSIIKRILKQNQITMR